MADQPIDMRKFAPIAAEIVPHPRKYLLDISDRLFWKGGDEIGTANAVLPQEWAHRTHDQSYRRD
jgi:hypothetical protein